MTEPKRGAVMLLTAGDPTIYGAIADGILTARAMMPVRDETPEAAIIRKRTAETLRRIDMRCRPKEADDDDIETRIMKARATYGTAPYKPSIVRTVGQKVLGVYALLVLRAREYFNFDNQRWKG